MKSQKNKLPWKLIWKEFNTWCNSYSAMEYPYEWSQQEPKLQRIIKKYRPKKYSRTSWHIVWNLFAKKYEHNPVEWTRQKYWIQILIERYTK